MQNLSAFAQLFLRLSIGAGYLVFGLDRLGVWGKYGEAGVSWGDWQHFLKRAEEIMNFLPTSVAGVLAVVATIAEIGFGTLLVFGKWTKIAAIGSGILALSFAVSMTISEGILSPLGYSVFTVSAASFLLATVNKYKWSLDNAFSK